MLADHTPPRLAYSRALDSFDVDGILAALHPEAVVHAAVHEEPLRGLGPHLEARFGALPPG